MEIPQIYYDQALRPRGNDANEKLKFVIDWYAKSATIIPTGAYQSELLGLTAYYSILLGTMLFSESCDATKVSIKSFLPTIEKRLTNNDITIVERAFFYYLLIELNKVLE